MAENHSTRRTQRNETAQPVPITASSRFIDLTGERFARWVVRYYAGGRLWYCQCDCGTCRAVSASSLKSGRSVSCGCFHAEQIAKHVHKATAANVRHGMSSSSEYKILQMMISRCADPKNISYPNYGGRGIQVCEEWQGPDGFQRFIDHIGRRPSMAHSVDRIDVNGNYEPGNVRWATSAEQGNNRRTNHRITHDGHTKNITEWAKEIGIPVITLNRRIARGWSVDRALTEKNHRINKGLGDLEYTAEYRVWVAMVSWCHNPKSPSFKRYGRKGISVCCRWRESFKNFVADMGLRPGMNYRVGRRDVAKDFGPANCFWQTNQELRRQLYGARILSYDGETKCIAEWADLYGLEPSTLTQRIDGGWSVEKALTTPPNKKHRRRD